MEIALVLVLGFVAYMYDSAERTRTALHRTFSALLAATLVHLVFDALTLYTMNHLDSVPKWLNDGLHRLFVGTMVLVVYLFYQYIAILVEEESGKPRKLDLAARVYLAIAEAGVLVLPVHYAVTPLGNYSDGIHADVCYVSVGVYLLLCAAQLAMEGGRSMKLLRVLLVDDEIMIREGFKRLFDWQAHGCEVVGEAADGVQALSQMEELKPDIVVMDINIPRMNGLKVISLWRMRNETTAFVIVSGYDDFSYCREALKLQITDYLLKPVDYEEFSACIDHLRIALFEKGGGARRYNRRGGEDHLEPHAVFAGAFERGDQPQSAGRRVPSEPAVYWPAFQKRDRRELPELSHEHSHGAGEEAARLHRPSGQRGGAEIRLRGLPRVYKGLQKG